MSELGELSQRVARVEGAYEHLATKADIEAVKGEIARQANKTIFALLAIIGAAVAVLKYRPG